jgi:hypothetical protein
LAADRREDSTARRSFNDLDEAHTGKSGELKHVDDPRHEGWNLRGTVVPHCSRENSTRLDTVEIVEHGNNLCREVDRRHVPRYFSDESAGNSSYLTASGHADAGGLT